MTSHPMPLNEELLNLLVERATTGITDDRQRELDQLIANEPCDDVGLFDHAVSLVELAFVDQYFEPLPAHLKSKLLHSAESDFARALKAFPSDHPTNAPSNQIADQSTLRWQFVSWLATAAAIAVAVAAWWPVAPAAAHDQRAQLLANATDATTLAWTATSPDRLADVEGDIVWSTEQQTGFMRFRGLPLNDPTKSQYQLWIVDPSRDKHPVDGGVFNVSADGELVVPIRAKLKVTSPQVFAITKEQPGGVVVSSGPLLLVAKAPA